MMQRMLPDDPTREMPVPLHHGYDDPTPKPDQTVDWPMAAVLCTLMVCVTVLVSQLIG